MTHGDSHISYSVFSGITFIEADLITHSTINLQKSFSIRMTKIHGDKLINKKREDPFPVKIEKVFPLNIFCLYPRSTT
ncbi:MAG TPA: hypothetical protein DCR24_05055 [Bacillus bacterium]|nr:hypothetical protein [Bacillus sp. (in: firmicutes)]